MQEKASTWALVLAAGEGSRLRILTRSATGTSIPKQFCSLRHGPSLLHEALRRAQEVAVRRHICTVVAAAHRHWWEPLLCHLPSENVIVQPANRGTAYGILLPLLHILERDPEANVVIFPSDHHVRHEPVLSRALQQASEQLQGGRSAILLLGLHPEETDPELGYIVPEGADEYGLWRVRQFVEKPPLSVAHELIGHGALWNAFILAASGASLLELFRQRLGAGSVETMRDALRADRVAGSERGALAALYDRFSPLDFSRDMLPGQESHLRVLPVPQCGWSDLGSPRRVADALRRLDDERTGTPPSMSRGYIDLAARVQAMQAAAAAQPLVAH